MPGFRCIEDISYTKMKSTDCVKFDKRVLEAIRDHYNSKRHAWGCSENDWLVIEHLDKLGEDGLKIPRWVFQSMWEEYMDSIYYTYSDKDEDSMVYDFMWDLGDKLFSYYHESFLFSDYYGTIYEDEVYKSEDDCTDSATKYIANEYPDLYYRSKE